ncbi:hypothetical protein ABIA15_005611 [Sinorhizobium fredii]
MRPSATAARKCCDLGNPGGEDVFRSCRCAELVRPAGGLDDRGLHSRRKLLRRQDLAEKSGGAGEHHVIGRHPGNQLRQDVALAVVGRNHIPGAAEGEVGSDFQRADGAARHHELSAAISLRTGVLRGMSNAEGTIEGRKSRNFRHLRKVVAAGRDDDLPEDLGARPLIGDRADQPRPFRRPLEPLHPGAETQMRQQAECEGIALQIIQHLLLPDIGGRARSMVQIGKGGHDPAGIGSHAGPGGAGGGCGVPLAAKARRGFHDCRHQAVGAEPAACGKAAGTRADHGDGGFGHFHWMIVLHGRASFAAVFSSLVAGGCFLKAS